MTKQFPHMRDRHSDIADLQCNFSANRQSGHRLNGKRQARCSRRLLRHHTTPELTRGYMHTTDASEISVESAYRDAWTLLEIAIIDSVLLAAYLENKLRWGPFHKSFGFPSTM
eukprot:GFYU01002510.1.p1 GENE.GFYU01002510.1~~GFYU01002510.1.p1  ORF type:complete len:113 (+),score=13.96 GFYU01002510.1:166-504(+)